MPNIPETWLDEQTVNITTAGNQSGARIIQLANGNILVVWTTNDPGGLGSPTGTEIFGQIFDPQGIKIGVEFRLNNASTLDNEQAPDIAALPNGGFVVVYHDVDEPFNGGASNIRLEEYDANGNGVAEDPLVVNDAALPADPNYSAPRVAVSSDTSVLITYIETSGGVSNVRGKIYNPTTDTYGPEISLLAFAGGNTDVSVAALTNGNYVIVARNTSTDSFIGYRVISSTGANVVGATVVTGTSSDTFTDFDASVAATAGGGFIITWSNIDANDTDIQARVYNSAGTQIDSFFTGDTGATNNNNESSVVTLTDGTFMVYYDNDELNRFDVSHVSAAGTNLGTFNLAGATTDLDAVALADGRSAVVWFNALGEISLEILDTRDAVNATPVNTTNLQVGTNDGDTFTVNNLTGAAYGGAGNDVITADGSVNVFGGEGNDTIFAGLGTSELLDGGAGVDTINTTLWSGDYDINLVTGVTNYAPESFVNFENVVTGVGNDSIVGSSAFNTISTGNGNDTITSGGSGLFDLGDGNDTFIAGNTFTTETANGGIGVDTLDLTVGNFIYTLVNLATGATNYASESFTNFENVITGSQNDTLFGTTGDNILNGGGGNDILAGLGGNDTLIGGTGGNQYIGSTGNDTFIVTADTTANMVLNSLIENVGEGTDEVRTTASVFALDWFGGSEIELLTVTDNGTHAALIGNAFNNTITGGTGTDDLFGRDGNDTLVGGSGAANSMYGAFGNDTYVVTAVGDSVIEFLGEGIDLVQAAVAAFTLGANVDNLTFTGANTARIGVGNDSRNIIRGLGGDDSLSGLGGADDIYGGSGADILQGGTQDDWFVYEGGETGMDRILDFVSGVDDIVLVTSGFTPTAVRDFVSGVGAVATSANSTIIYHPNTGIVYYDDDGNGAGAPIALAQLNGGQTFVATDFLFI